MANNKFYNALNQISQSTPPIWFMRQAGRYHSHYQQLKLKYSFEELCKNAELAAEVAGSNLEFGRTYLIPKPFDRRVLIWEASAVAPSIITAMKNM